MERTFSEAGIKLQVAMQLYGTEAVKKAVEANLGFGVEFHGGKHYRGDVPPAPDREGLYGTLP